MGKVGTGGAVDEEKNRHEGFFDSDGEKRGEKIDMMN